MSKDSNPPQWSMIFKHFLIIMENKFQNVKIFLKLIKYNLIFFLFSLYFIGCTHWQGGQQIPVPNRENSSVPNRENSSAWYKLGVSLNKYGVWIHQRTFSYQDHQHRNKIKTSSGSGMGKSSKSYIYVFY